MNAQDHSKSGDGRPDELERLILDGVSLDEIPPHSQGTGNDVEAKQFAVPASDTKKYEREDGDSDSDEENSTTSDLQGALGLFAEATSDLATASVELGLGRHFACVDFCNQAVEKAAQSVSLLRFGRRSMYNHDLRGLGARVGAPEDIQEEMSLLTPFHPEAFYADTPPEEADEVISAEQAESYRQHARHVLRWVRNIVLNA